MQNIDSQLMRLFPAALIVMLSFTACAYGGGNSCAHCGCNDGCQKICRLVVEEKKVKVTCWGCESEDFCIPGRSQPGCKHGKWVCDNSDAKAPCVQPKQFVWTEWIPSCEAKLHTKQKLMKRTITKTVPGYKWVVESLCEPCQADCLQQTVPPGADVPPPPKAGAKVLLGVPAAGLLSTTPGMTDVYESGLSDVD